MLRTHTSAEINKTTLDQTVTLAGWVHRRRDHGGLIFIDLRDREGIVQVVCDPQFKVPFQLAEKLRNEYVVQIQGKIRHRPAGTVNSNLTSGEVELLVHEIHLLNEAA